jgi:hypothetical protein
LQFGLAQQLSDHWQGFRASGGVAGKAAAQIVQPDARKIGLDLHIPSERCDAADRLAPKPFKRGEQLPGFVAQPGRFLRQERNGANEKWDLLPVPSVIL